MRILVQHSIIDEGLAKLKNKCELITKEIYRSITSECTIGLLMSSTQLKIVVSTVEDIVSQRVFILARRNNSDCEIES